MPPPSAEARREESFVNGEAKYEPAEHRPSNIVRSGRPKRRFGPKVGLQSLLDSRWSTSLLTADAKCYGLRILGRQFDRESTLRSVASRRGAREEAANHGLLLQWNSDKQTCSAFVSARAILYVAL